MEALQKEKPCAPPAPDEADQIIAYHGGDATEAVRTLVAERDVLFERLMIARIAMGHGFTHRFVP